MIAGHRPGPRRRRGQKARPPHQLLDPPGRRGAPRIDPKPILDGWKLLEATAIYRAKGKNPFSQAERRRRPAALQGGAAEARPRDKRLDIYGCGRTDIAAGQIDRRILAMLEYLIAKGYS